MAIVTTRSVSSNLGLLDRKPEKVVLIANPGQENAEPFTVLLNPKSLKETINVEWSKLPVIGLDHEVPHYSRTKSISVPMSFYFSAFEQARQSGNSVGNVSSGLANSQQFPVSQLNKQSTDFVNFLRSLCFPTRDGLRPPTVKVVWRNVLNFLAVVETVSFEYMKFDRTLAPIVYQADVTFLEVRLSRRYSEDVRRVGLVGDNDPSLAIQTYLNGWSV